MTSLFSNNIHITCTVTLQAQRLKLIPLVYVDCFYSHSHPQVVMCPLLCRPLCCQIMAQAPISKPGLLLFPKQVRQEGGSGQSLRLGGKVQILAPGFFPLGLLMA